VDIEKREKILRIFITRGKSKNTKLHNVDDIVEYETTDLNYGLDDSKIKEKSKFI